MIRGCRIVFGLQQLFTRAIRLAAIVSLAVLGISAVATADEGLWPYTNPPLAQLKQAFGFEPDAAWFDHLRLSSVRIRARGWPGNNAASGCFVGKSGVVLTCRHVVTDILAWNWSLEENIARDGLLATRDEGEVPCPGLEIEVLRSIENVTAEVDGAIAEEESPSRATQSRRTAIDAILRREKTSDLQRSEVVSLYGDTEHWLYRFDKYNDVRLVFLPESFAPSDPRIPVNSRVLDAALLRVFRDGRKITPDHWLQPSASTVNEGDFVAAFGNPYRTARLRSIPEVSFMRAIGVPVRLKLIDAMIFACTGVECDAPSRGYIAGFAADLKKERESVGRELESLNNAIGIERVDSLHKMIRERLRWNPSKLSEYDHAAEVLESGFSAYSLYAERDFWLQAIADSIARTRQPVFTPSESLMRMSDRLYSLCSAPVNLPHFMRLEPRARGALAEALLASIFEQARRSLGDDDPLIIAALDGWSTTALAKAVCAGTRSEPAKKLAHRDEPELGLVGANDPLKKLLGRIDPIRKELQERAEVDLGKDLEDENAKIAASYYLAFGNGWPPDANATPRFSFGKVCGWSNDRQHVRWRDSYNDYLGHVKNDGAQVPVRWRAAAEEVGEALTHSFLTTCDAVGGNSGGPVVDREGKLCGVITNGSFNEDVYDDSASRSTALNIDAIILVLRRVYRADDLADEIMGK